MNRRIDHDKTIIMRNIDLTQTRNPLHRMLIKRNFISCVKFRERKKIYVIVPFMWNNQT